MEASKTPCQSAVPTGIAVCIGMASTFAYANSALREQVSLKVSPCGCKSDRFPELQHCRPQI